jgi:hypothetical protein
MTVVAALIDNEPLSQVVFVRDYVQLVFQDTTLSVYCSMSVALRRDSIGWHGPGWCDALVALIGQSVTSVDYLPRSFEDYLFRRQRSQDMLAGLACDV